MKQICHSLLKIRASLKTTSLIHADGLNEEARETLNSIDGWLKNHLSAEEVEEMQRRDESREKSTLGMLRSGHATIGDKGSNVASQVASAKSLMASIAG